MLRPLLTLYRIEDNFQYGMFGVLLIQTEIFCDTLEPYEFQNQKNISCIPPGFYECKRVVSPKFGTTYEICNVPERSNILFHAGNVIEDTKGCVILAEKRGKLKGQRAVLNSGNTFTKFLNELNPYKEFDLRIKEVF